PFSRLSPARERGAVLAFHLHVLRKPWFVEEQWYSKAAAARRLRGRSASRVRAASARICSRFSCNSPSRTASSTRKPSSTQEKGDAEPRAEMKTTLVLSPKGGAGKTTIATNLASCFAAADLPTTLMEYDPQGSSMNWLRLRPPPPAPRHRANRAAAR